MFLEHKHLYRQPYNRSEYPDRITPCPSVKRAWLQKGRTSASSPTGPWSTARKWRLRSSGVKGTSVEIVDLRSLSPYDWEAIAATVRKNHRVIVAYEDMLSGVTERKSPRALPMNFFEELDAPVRRVAAMDTFCAYQPNWKTNPSPDFSPDQRRQTIVEY